MRKATAIYNAPEGDSKVVEMGGVTFFDGKEVELNTRDHAHMITKLQGNPHFDIAVGEEEPDEKRKPGRPSKAEAEARAAKEAEAAKAEAEAAKKAAASA